MGLNGKLAGPGWTLRNKRHFVVSDFAVEDFYCILDDVISFGGTNHLSNIYADGSGVLGTHCGPYRIGL